MYCWLCGANETRLVRDHCHLTGFIRGILCEQCNNYIGFYEKWKLPRRNRQLNYFAWVDFLRVKLSWYLNRHTELRYPGATFEEVAQAWPL